MSGIAQKVKDTMSSDKNTTNTTNTTTSTTTGGHYDATAPRTAGAPGTTVGGPTAGSNYTSGTTGTSGLSHTAGGPAPGTDGPHKSDMLNKADPRIDSNRDHSTNMGMNKAGTAATGSLAHSQTANRDEPLIGSGIGGTTTGHPVGTSAAHGSSMTANHGPTGPAGGTIGNTHHTPTAGGIGSTGYTAGGIGSTGHTAGGIGSTGHTAGGIGSTGHTTGAREGDFGPHSGRMANAADPRVDSDLDNSKRMGGNTHTTGTTAGIGSTGHTGTTGGIGSTGHTTGTTGGIGSSHHTTGTTGGIGSTGHTTGTSGVREGEFGPHSGRAANAADPRVDSDLDGGRNTRSTGTTGTTGGLGSSHQTTGTTGTTGGLGSNTHTTAGHSTTGTTGAHHGTTTTTTGPGSKTTGPAPNTAGPHKSDMLNKVDPRVDSNLDGSKTVGGDKTHAADKRI